MKLSKILVGKFRLKNSEHWTQFELNYTKWLKWTNQLEAMQWNEKRNGLKKMNEWSNQKGHRLSEYSQWIVV